MTTLAAPTNPLHASLIEALGSSDPEGALEQSFIQLSRGANLPLVLAMIKALTRVGLAGIALRLLHAATGVLSAQPHLAALAEQLSRAPSGEVPPEILRQRFAANRDALLTSNPQLQNVSQLLSIPSVRIYQSAAGNVHAIWDRAGAPLDFIFPFAHSQAHTRAVRIQPVQVGVGFVQCGVPSPALFKRLHDLKADNGYQPPIAIVEPDLDVLSAWLCMIDDAAAFGSERVAVFAGPDALEQYRRHLCSHPTRRPATQAMTNFRARFQPPRIDRTFNESVLQEIMARKQAAKAHLDEMYRGRDARYWRDRFATAGTSALPLRIVGCTTRYSTVLQHAMRDLAAAFRRLNCEFHLVSQSAMHETVTDIIGAIRHVQPDLVICFNHLRLDMRDDVPANIPYVCWIQDYMPQLWRKEAGASIGELDLLLGHAPDVMVSNFGYPAQQFLATTNLSSPDVFNTSPLSEGDLQRYGCDLAYAGHGSETPEELIVQAAGDQQGFAATLKEILRITRERLSRQHFITTQDLVDIVLEAESCSSQNFTVAIRQSMIVPAAQRLIDRVIRHQTLEWAATWARQRGRNLALYGRGWQRHPTLSEFARGELEHGESLRRMYRAAKINLQVNAYGSLHQRLLDGLASGGFMLARFNPADFVRKPFAQIQAFIRQNNVRSLEQLMRCAMTESTLAQAMHDAETLTGTRLAPTSDARRAQHVKAHVSCGSLQSSDFDDAGLLELLTTRKSIPTRAAGDLPNFDSIVFKTQEEFHAQLDRYVDDAQARHAIVEPMRTSVLEHDTYDVLAARILRAFEAQWRDIPVQPCA